MNKLILKKVINKIKINSLQNRIELTKVTKSKFKKSKSKFKKHKLKLKKIKLKFKKH